MDPGVLGEVVRGLLPTVGVSLLFAVAIWAIVRADASERSERARIEAEEDAAVAGAVTDSGARSGPGSGASNSSREGGGRD